MPGIPAVFFNLVSFLAFIFIFVAYLVILESVPAVGALISMTWILTLKHFKPKTHPDVKEKYLLIWYGGTFVLGFLWSPLFFLPLLSYLLWICFHLIRFLVWMSKETFNASKDYIKRIFSE